MMCVKLTLPPRPRARWLLITMRLSAMSLAGTARTLVAMGSASEASMLETIFAATPRIGVVWAPAGSAFAGSTGAGAGSTGAGAAATGAGRVGAGAAGAVGAELAGAGAGAAGAEADADPSAPGR